MYIGVLSPQRGLPAASAYASKIAAIASPVGIPERTRPATSATETPQSRIVGIRATSSRKRSASIVRPWRRASSGTKNDSSGMAMPGERSRITRSSVVPERLTPSRISGRRHSGSVTTTSARAARPPTVT